jgi:hypothetical protein
VLEGNHALCFLFWQCWQFCHCCVAVFLLCCLQILAEALQVVRRCKEGQPIQQLWGTAAAAAGAGEDRAPLAEQQQQQ